MDSDVNPENLIGSLMMSPDSLFASGVRANNIARARELLDPTAQEQQQACANEHDQAEPTCPSRPCPCCRGRMIAIETFERGRVPRAFSLNDFWIDTS